MGRETKSVSSTQVISSRLPCDLIAKIDVLALEEHRTRANVIINILAHALEPEKMSLNLHKPNLSLIGGQMYLRIPVERVTERLGPHSTVWQAKPETGLEIITKRTRKKAR
jgi:hypothetical protein